jgi:hypothetical protein
MPQTIKKDLSYLGKSLFLKGLQCPKYLYLFKTRPDLLEEVSESQEAVFSQGTEVGIAARGLFPDGQEIPYEGQSLDDQLKQTRLEIDRGASVLYEPAFTYDQIFIKADILRKTRKGWDLYEVKAGTKIENVYLDDIALQYYVLLRSGLSTGKAYLIYINNQYVKKGALDVNQLFIKEDVTEQVLEKQKFIGKEIKKLRTALRGGIPSIDIGRHCGDPYPCDFKEHCWQHLPEYSVLDLSGRKDNPWEFYEKGILHLKDIPMERLTKNQRIEVEAFLKKRKFVNRKR